MSDNYGVSILIYGWSPTIGDPTLWGWATVLHYAAAFLITALAALKDERNSKFWLAISLLMLVLCVNKQLDIQSLITAVGRVVAKNSGWYQDRAIYQIVFVGMVAIAGILLVLVMGVAKWRSRKSVVTAAFGIVLLTGFVVMRAASFHKVDLALGMSFSAVKLNYIAENLAAGLILISAVNVVLWTPKKRRRTLRQ